MIYGRWSSSARLADRVFWAQMVSVVKTRRKGHDSKYGSVDEEGKAHPKKKKDDTGSSKDAAPAESTKIKAPRGRRRNAKFLADLNWVRTITIPVNGSVSWMGSKRLQTHGATGVTLGDTHEILVVVSAWKFNPSKAFTNREKARTAQHASQPQHKQNGQNNSPPLSTAVF